MPKALLRTVTLHILVNGTLFFFLSEASSKQINLIPQPHRYHVLDGEITGFEFQEPDKFNLYPLIPKPKGGVQFKK